MTLLIKVFFICISVYAVLGQNIDRHSLSQGSEISLLNNPRYLERLLKCVLGEVPCDSNGKRLKSLAPSILRNQCTQCTPAEIKYIRESLAYIQRHHPSAWARIVRMYRY